MNWHVVKSHPTLGAALVPLAFPRMNNISCWAHVASLGRFAISLRVRRAATTLEWTMSSPPPAHQFDILPRISERQ